MFLGPLLGGLAANFYPLPMNALLFSEVILTEVLLDQEL